MIPRLPSDWKARRMAKEARPVEWRATEISFGSRRPKDERLTFSFGGSQRTIQKFPPCQSPWQQGLPTGLPAADPANAARSSERAAPRGERPPAGDAARGGGGPQETDDALESLADKAPLWETRETIKKAAFITNARQICRPVKTFQFHSSFVPAHLLVIARRWSE